MKRYETPAMFSTFGGIAAAFASVATLAIMVVLPASYGISAGSGTLAKRPAVPAMAAAPHLDAIGGQALASPDCREGRSAEQG
ncbi:MAG: hypothetical protein ABI920_01395 [Casimicrobiaceae bacterium]